MFFEIRTTIEFDKWLTGLRDREGRARINVRIERFAEGNPGDVKPLGGGLHEMRIPFGPGYRVYYAFQGKQIVLLLAGGQKRGQSADIEEARRLWDREKGDQ